MTADALRRCCPECNIDDPVEHRLDHAAGCAIGDSERVSHASDQRIAQRARLGYRYRPATAAEKALLLAWGWEIPVATFTLVTRDEGSGLGYRRSWRGAIGDTATPSPTAQARGLDGTVIVDVERVDDPDGVLPGVELTVPSTVMMPATITRYDEDSDTEDDRRADGRYVAPFPTGVIRLRHADRQAARRAKREDKK